MCDKQEQSAGDNVAAAAQPADGTAPAAGEVFNLKLINATLENIVVLGLEPQAACDELQAQVEEIFSAY